MPSKHRSKLRDNAASLRLWQTLYGKETLPGKGVRPRSFPDGAGKQSVIETDAVITAGYDRSKIRR